MSEEEELTQQHCNLALAIQQVTEEIVLKLAAHAKAITSSNNICLSGGVALNCVANGKLQNANIFDNIFIQPAIGDAGGAMGSALAAHHIYFEKERSISSGMDAMKGSYLGPSFSTDEIEATIQQYKAVATAFNNRNELNKTIAAQISEGNVIGWFQGRMEFGPVRWATGVSLPIHVIRRCRKS